MNKVTRVETKWDIDGKQSIRRAVTKNYRTNEVAKEAGFLPAEHCLCIKEAMKNGTIDQGTKLFLFDRSEKVLLKAKAECYRLGFLKVEIFKGDALDSIEFLLDAKNFHPDFVFLDLCGQYSAKIQQVMSRLLKLCPVSLTVMPYFRHPKLVSGFIDKTDRCNRIATKVLNNKERERKYGFEGEEPTEGVKDTAISILSSIMSTTPKRVKVASVYRGMKRQMMSVAIG
jgi:hypothetical protein